MRAERDEIQESLQKVVDAFAGIGIHVDDYGGKHAADFVKAQHKEKEAWEHAAKSLQAELAGMTKERNGWRHEAKRAQRDHADARAELSALRAATRGDVWFHQGDGEDYPESLTCRVVMYADDYRKLMGARNTDA